MANLRIYVVIYNKLNHFYMSRVRETNRIVESVGGWSKSIVFPSIITVDLKLSDVKLLPNKKKKEDKDEENLPV